MYEILWLFAFLISFGFIMYNLYQIIKVNRTEKRAFLAANPTLSPADYRVRRKNINHAMLAAFPSLNRKIATILARVGAPLILLFLIFYPDQTTGIRVSTGLFFLILYYLQTLPTPAQQLTFVTDYLAEHPDNPLGIYLQIPFERQLRIRLLKRVKLSFLAFAICCLLIP